jgi:hypothetical protein
MMTRLPIRATEGFGIRIHHSDSSNPNKEFIRASICFNRLYLPASTTFEADWQMIATAVPYSPTTGNQ